MDSEPELRKSGRSTRRTSFSEAGPRDLDSFEDDFDTLGMATPPPNTPKKSRRSSVEEEKVTKSSSESAFVDESKHSFKFTMTKEDFLRDLYSFMKSRGQAISKLPSLGYQELDLYLLYQLVIARGGMDEVTRKQEWKLVYQDLGIPTMSTSASYNTRTNYKKYMYLYELEHCDFPDKNRPKDARPKYHIGEFIRIVSSVFEGQVFYARILKCRFMDGKNQYYVHYNGWNSSHDEWMREDVLDPLEATERKSPELLANPPPSRSSKSNHLIYDPTVSEKVINNLVSSQNSKPPKLTMQNPLSPASPASFKKKSKHGDLGGSSGDEEIAAANELISGMERQQRQHRDDQQSSARNYYQKDTQAYRPVEVLRYPMRSDPGEDIAKILEDKRNGSHEQDLIHRNRLHTHVLMKSTGIEEDERERQIIAELLGSVKVRIEESGEGAVVVKQPVKLTRSKSSNNFSRSRDMDHSLDDPRNLHDIQESLVSLQASLLATQTSYKHAMKALKKHHNLQVLPPMPPQPKKNVIGTRRSDLQDEIKKVIGLAPCLEGKMSFEYPILSNEIIPIDTSSNVEALGKLLLVIFEFLQRVLRIWLDSSTDLIGIRKLSAAMTNTVYIISNGDCNTLASEPKKILLRVYGQGIESILNRAEELEWFLKLSKARAGPQLLATFQNGRIEEYIESVTLTPNMMRGDGISKGIAQALAKFHGLEVDGDDHNELVLWSRLESWRHEAGQVMLSLSKQNSGNPVLQKIKGQGVFDESEFSAEGKFKIFFDKLVAYKSPIVPCHNDLQHGNILLTDTGKIVFIDYEYGGMNYAAYDIANHFCEWASDFTEANSLPHIMNFELKYPILAEREQFIRAYLAESNSSTSDINEWIKAVEEFKELSHLLWAYWGIIQANNSTIDFDYLGYSLMRLEAMTL